MSLDISMLMVWNEVFWILSLISLFLSIILFGLPYMSSRALSKITRGRADQVRLRKFFGHLVIPCFVLLICILGLFLVKSVYSFVAYFQIALSQSHKPDDVNGLITLVITIIVSLVVVMIAIYWVKRLWRNSANDKTEKTDDEQLRDAIKTLNQKLNKLDKLDKLDQLDRLDRLFNYIESDKFKQHSHKSRPN